MYRSGNLERLGEWCFLAAVFLLPWQTRYIFWRAPVGTGESEYAILSLYATQVLIVMAFLLLRPWRAKNVKPAWLGASLVGLGALVAVSQFSLATLGWLFTALSAAMLFALAAMMPLRKVGMAFLLGILPVFLLGIFQVVTGGSSASTELGLAARDAERLGESVTVLDGTRVLRAYGSFPHPNIFGAYSLAGVVLAYLIGRAASRSTVWYVIGVFCAVGVVLSMSHAALLGLGILALCVGLRRFSERVFFRGTKLVAVLVFILWTVAVPLLALVGSEASDRSLSERQDQVFLWGELFSAPRTFFLGTGLGASTFVHAATETGREAWFYQPVHSVPLLVMLELGLPLTLLLGWGMWKYGRRLLGTHGPFFVAILPSLLFDHFWWTLWPGMALPAFFLAVLTGECYVRKIQSKHI